MSASLNNLFIATEQQISPEVVQQLRSVPIGSVVAWLKSYTNTPALPDQWTECNGQVLSDAESVYNGQTIPNLNGASASTKRFLRGSETSGSTGGTDTHYHTGQQYNNQYAPSSGTADPYFVNSPNTSIEGTLPSYYEVVWIMRVK